MSHSGIVSKLLNLSQNVLDHLVVPSFRFFLNSGPIPNSKRNPVSGGGEYRGGKILQFSTEIAVYLGKTVRDRPMVTIER